MPEKNDRFKSRILMDYDPADIAAQQMTQVCALDCEMVKGVNGQPLLASVSIVNLRGAVLFSSFVRIPGIVRDYRTEVTGIRPHNLVDAPPYFKVRTQVMKLLKDKVVVGHDVKHDLRVLRFYVEPNKIRDTSTYGPFVKMLGKGKAGLKELARAVLKITVHEADHSPVANAQIAMALYRSQRNTWETLLSEVEVVPVDSFSTIASNTDSAGQSMGIGQKNVDYKSILGRDMATRAAKNSISTDYKGLKIDFNGGNENSVLFNKEAAVKGFETGGASLSFKTPKMSSYPSGLELSESSASLESPFKTMSLKSIHDTPLNKALGSPFGRSASTSPFSKPLSPFNKPESPFNRPVSSLAGHAPPIVGIDEKTSNLLFSPQRSFADSSRWERPSATASPLSGRLGLDSSFSRTPPSAATYTPSATSTPFSQASGLAPQTPFEQTPEKRKAEKGFSFEMF